MCKVRIGLVAVVVMSSIASVSCSKPIEETTTLAARVDSGFDFATEAFVFENFGGDARGTQLDTQLMVRMFGEPAVCVPGSDPCELSGVADAWRRTTNQTLDTGRSEGFSALALLFYKGALAPEDFGGETVADLRLVGNPALQSEFAYWAATQAVPTATASDRRFTANKVMPFLEEALAPNAEGAWRLAIAQKTEFGFQRGHALVPIGYYRGEGGVYWLRVYDNNFPAREQLLEINPDANTWRYTVQGLLGEEIVYEGNSENKNQLYFSNVLERTQLLQAPFAQDSDTFTVTTSGMSAVVTIDGEQTGIVDGEVVEFGEDRVVPAFSRCPLCGEPVAIINQKLLDKGIRDYKNLEIVANPNGKSTIVQDKRSISSSGPGYTATVTPSSDAERHELGVNDDGSVRYTFTGGGEATVEVTKTDEFGRTTTVEMTVKVPEGEQNDARITFKKGGVELDRVPEGTSVNYKYKETDANGDSKSSNVDFQTTGEDVFVTQGGEDGTRTTFGDDDSVKNVSADSCSNGVFDPTTETDVDCGNLCAPCSVGKSCWIERDCVGWEDNSGGCVCVQDESGDCVLTPDESGELRPTNICRSSLCENNTKDAGETDVDCGGDTCAPCVASNDASAPSCSVASDCDSNACVDSKCRVRRPVSVQIPKTIDTTDRYFRLEYRLDGGETQTIELLASALFAGSEIQLGDAFSYAIDFAGTCRTDFGVTKTVADGQTVTLDCPDAGEYYLILQPLSEDQPTAEDPLALRLTLDDQTSTYSHSGDATKYLGTFSTSWSLRAVDQPKNSSYGVDQAQYLECVVSPTARDLETPYSPLNRAYVQCSPQMNAPLCGDRKRNQNESDVDCGGDCAPCSDDKECNTTSDCDTRECAVDFTCSGDALDTCNDARKNGSETDIDCGGWVNGAPVCDRCEVSRQCTRDENCAADLECHQNRCSTIACDDGRSNGLETDIDCGGMTCDACADGARCSVASDCTSGVCDNDLCAAPSCSDSVQNQDETDTDCGGAVCGPCADGLVCAADSDCASGTCESDRCGPAATCSDSVQNQGETATDCGGPNCSGCADGLACSAGSDCASSYCNPSNQCATPTCSDSIQNQGETDVDCGGSSCAGCAAGLSCSSPSDCASGLCTNGSCEAAPTCSDGIQNQGETATDCGGPNCSACTGAVACTNDSDCASSDCECGQSSGACAGNSGVCGEGKLVVTAPTTDGVASSGSFTVPTGCSEVYVQAWGAAGGPAGEEDPFTFLLTVYNAGGAGGYVSGTIPVSQGDVLNVWVGQGGAAQGQTPGGEPGIGSDAGTRTDGGLPDQNFGSIKYGGGGGLTSISQTGSATTTIYVPAGGGASDAFAGEDVSMMSGGGAMGRAGESAGFGSMQAGGGAGATGGAIDASGYGLAGTYGTLPMGFVTEDGSSGVPGGTGYNDYNECVSQAGLNAGESDTLTGYSGDGCVILRCVGQ